MGGLIRAYDWASTSLGPPERWPQALKTTVRLLLSTGHPMFIWWGPELIQFYNDAYRRSIGSERHPSALGGPGRACWAEIWDIIGPQIKQVMQGRGHTWHENQLVPITRHGKREDVYWTYSYSPIDEPSAPNGVGGVLVVCTETTAQVLAEKQLSMEEARWRELFDQAPGFMCTLQGPEHVFEYANRRYYDLVAQRDIVGKSVREALPEVVAQGFIELLDTVYRTGEAHVGVATPLLLASVANRAQQRVFIDFVYQPIRDSQGHVMGIFVEGSDVTERVHALEALQSADRRKDEFLAMLAHELRNPLAAIRNVSVLLTRMSATDPKTHAIGSLLDRQVNQLTRLVDDLLDVARITQGRIELQRSHMNLGEALDLAIETVQPLMKERHHDVVVERPSHPLFVAGDLTRLTQCIVNILTNAAKYTSDGGRVQVALRESQNEAVVDIEDNGSGISREMLPKIFDLFVQADRTLERSQGGLGIGLSVVQKLVQMHGGRVTAQSAGLGRGSKFSIRLPIIASPSAGTPLPIESKTKAKRVLIVDDNADAADSLAQLLGFEGHVTDTAYTAADALARASTFSADVILLDIGLPETDGYEVVRQMRAAGRSETIIALTGYGQASDVRRARETGFDAHLTKPVDFPKLQRLLDS